MGWRKAPIIPSKPIKGTARGKHGHNPRVEPKPRNWIHVLDARKKAHKREPTTQEILNNELEDL